MNLHRILVLILIASAVSPHPAQGESGAVVRDQANDIAWHAKTISDSLAYLGSPLPEKDTGTIAALTDRPPRPGHEATISVERLLDPYCIATVDIAKNERVSVSAANPTFPLQQAGWTNYLVKIRNHAAYTGRLEVQSPNSEALFIETRDETRMRPEEMLTRDQLHQRFLSLVLYRNLPLKPELSGAPIEYAILQIYTKRSGHLPADLDFFIGDYYRDMKPLASSFLRPPDGLDSKVGLRGEYFDNTEMSGKPVLTRVDREINFGWTGSSPDASVPQEDFSVRWTGQLVAPESGLSRLGTRSNDGSRVYLDGELVVNNWGLHGTVLKTGEVMLTEGRGHDLLVEYFQGGGSAEVRLELDIGPLNPTRIHLEFDAAPAVPVTLRVRDEDGPSAMASFTFTDGIDRYEKIPVDKSKYGQTLNFGYSDYERKARREYEHYPEDLVGIYPLPSRRLPVIDPHPDQYFHAQVYRGDGEQVLLPPGNFRIAYTRGPEYRTGVRSITIPEGAVDFEVAFQLERWIHMRELGYYSSDSHIHASGCCYYTNPEEGLRPEHVWRMQLGEDVNVANILNWGPNWYHQKENFTGHDHPLSGPEHIMRYNVEMSGFPSSHAGHVVLLGLHEDDYPGTTVIEDWPTWNLPILRWAKQQGALTGYAHSGWGLTPMGATWELPNYVLPRMDDIGANEYIVTITEGVVDFYSVGDTPVPWELNMWYHTLNCGFRARLSGETDYPCIYDERVGEARSYVKLDGPLVYADYLDSIKRGSGYVSDGRTHIVDFSVGDTSVGSGDSELTLESPGTVTVTARVAALLPSVRSEVGEQIAASDLDRQPYLHIERARIESSRDVAVELVVNGIVVDRQPVTADGAWKELSFDCTIESSAWLALRVFPSAHTNPIFALVDGRPIQVRKSAEWARRVVDQCWKTKESEISADEHDAAFDAFERARGVYDKIIEYSP